MAAKDTLKFVSTCASAPNEQIVKKTRVSPNFGAPDTAKHQGHVEDTDINLATLDMATFRSREATLEPMLHDECLQKKTKEVLGDIKMDTPRPLQSVGYNELK